MIILILLTDGKMLIFVSYTICGYVTYLHDTKYNLLVLCHANNFCVFYLAHKFHIIIAVCHSPSFVEVEFKHTNYSRGYVIIFC